MKARLNPTLRVALAMTIALVTVKGLTAAESATAQRREEVAGMQGVSLRLPAELHLRQGAPEVLTIDAEPRVLDRIEVLRRDGVIVIQSKAPGFQTRHPVVLRLSLRTVRVLHADSAAAVHTDALRADRLRIELEGSDDLVVERLDVGHLTVRLSGSGSATIAAGQADAQDVELDGAGDYMAIGLATRQARVKAMGSGSAHIRATGSVDAFIEGSGDIVVAGSAQVRSHIDGAGDIIRRP